MRLRNQFLAKATASDPASAVAWFGAMQAQEYAIAKWSVAQRVTGLDDAAVQRAVDDGRILRTHALRPTWHFVAASDLCWIQALTGPRVHAFSAYYYRLHGLDDATAERTNAVIVGALRGGKALTRPEIGVVLADAGLPATGNRLAYIVMRAELDGLIANGPMRGKQHTYALVAERAPVQTELHGDDALAELTRRYFTSHGPATVKDFAWWSSLTLTQVRHGIEVLGDELSSAEVAGRRYWWAAASTTVDASGATPRARERAVTPIAHVLQAYDEYAIAYKESRDLLNLAGLPVVLPNENTTVHLVVVDGQLVALWRSKAERGGISADLRPVRPLAAADRRDVMDAFARYATFAGIPVHVQIRPA